MQGNTRLLLVTTRRLTSPTGEWRLIANRSRALSSCFSIHTDVICIRTPLDNDGFLNADEWAVKATYFGLRRWMSPLLMPSVLRAKREISRWLMDNPRGVVMISGVQLYFLSLGIPRDRLIVDLHGTLDEWRELGSNNRRSRVLRVLYPVASFAERLMLNGARGALVVSRELAAYAGRCGAGAAWRIPCGILSSQTRMGNEGLRIQWRAKWGLPDSVTLFVYSGGLSKWQCIREAIHLFRAARSSWPGRCHLLIATPNVDALRHAVGSLESDSITACSIPAEHVQEALTACDIGLLLRENNKTNRCAYPNKFAEYVAAGLFVVTSPGLTDPAEFVERHRLGLLIDPVEVSEGRTADWCNLLLKSFQNRGSRMDFACRASNAALEELSMERLVAPLAGDLMRLAS